MQSPQKRVLALPPLGLRQYTCLSTLGSSQTECPGSAFKT
jgi:hypothetical protein